MAGRHAEAERALRRAIELEEKLATDSPSVSIYQRDLATSQLNLGEILWKTGHHAEAEKAERRAISLLEKLATEAPSVPLYRSLLATCQSNLGGVLDNLGRQAEAEQSGRRAVALDEELAGESPSVPQYRCELARHQSNLGEILDKTGHHAEAEQWCRRAIALAETLVTEPNSVPEYRFVLAGSNLTLGGIMERASRRAEARRAYLRVTELAEKLEDPEAQNQLCWSLAIRPNLEPDLFRPVLPVAKKTVEYDPQSGGYWNTLGVVHYRLGHWKAAIEALEKSMQLRKGGDPSNWFFLAMAHRQTGQEDQARRWYDKSDRWIEKQNSQDQELRGFRAEAAALLGLTDNPRPSAKKEENSASPPKP